MIRALIKKCLKMSIISIGTAIVFYIDEKYYKLQFLLEITKLWIKKNNLFSNNLLRCRVQSVGIYIGFFSEEIRVLYLRVITIF